MNEQETQFDRLPPHDVEAEQCLLSSMMIDNDFIDQAVEIVTGPEAFYLTDHAIIFKAIVGMRLANKPVDAVLLRAELTRQGVLDDIGGAIYLAEILHAVPSAAHGPHYAAVVVKTYRLREIISAANDALRSAYAYGAEADEIASGLARKAESIRDTGGSDGIVSIGQAAAEVVRSLRSPLPRRLLTGFAEGEDSLDATTGGIPFRGHTLIGGRPGMGKSQLAKQLALRWAQGGIPVGLVTVEEDRNKIADNMLANVSDVPNWKIQRGDVSDREHGELIKAQERLQGLPLFVDDTASTINQVETACRRLVRKHGCRVLVVDHLHIIQHHTRGTRNDQISEISSRLKQLWKRLDVAGVVVCQLNRKDVDGENSVPTLTNLREGGALEQDGDLIMLLHRRDYYRKEAHEMDRKMEVHVAKNKGGATGCAWLYFDGNRQALYDWNNGRGNAWNEDATLMEGL